MDKCRCNCGYICGGPDVCKEPYLDCISKHYKRDCDHEFNGWKEVDYGGTAVCKHCGLEAMAHDMRVGP